MRNFSQRSLNNLEGVHRDLVRVVEHCLQHGRHDFVVIEGLRTRERQAELLKAGASRTMNSRHITGHAVDLAVWLGGTVRWDWPLYEQLGADMKSSAAFLNVAIVWGGDWKTFRDGPHFELART